MAMNDRICDEAREQLLDFLEERHGAGASLPDSLSRHVAGCPQCRSLVAVTSQLQAGLSRADLYGAGLKRRTMAAVSNARQPSSRTLTGLLATAGFVSFCVCILTPWLIVWWLTGLWVSESVTRFALAAWIMASVGMMIAAVLFVVVRSLKQGSEGEALTEW